MTESNEGLKFQYSSEQPHQIAAINATVDLFKDQQFRTGRFTLGASEQWLEELGVGEDNIKIGFANTLRVSERQLVNSLHEVQERNCLPKTEALTDGHLRDFTIEMETGTGKTYVYIRSIYELNKRYGLTKFIIVVPSVAIREGVRKSFETMKEHFGTLYDGVPLDYFVYDSKDMGNVGNFAMSSSIQVMIINIGAFNKAFDQSGEEDKSNLFHRKSENLAGGRSPQEMVAECNPIVIIDEPQSVDNTAKAKKAIRSLNPLFVLRYSATHKDKYNMIYRLTPVDAFQEHLVKGICVDSVLAQANLNGSYVRLDKVETDPYKAKLTIDVRQKDGSQKRKAVTVKVGSNLYERSGENTDYEAGWIVSNIDTAEGQESIEFQNGTYLELGEVEGDVDQTLIKRAQIRRTIENHLERQLEMWPRDVKVLSLFFIDKVGKYREYLDDGGVADGEYARMFDEEYRDLTSSAKWRRRYEKAGVKLIDDPQEVRTAYFSEDKKRRFKDTNGGTAADTDTFQLIMRKKETLISFPDGKDPEKNYAFIFSHSALKEGWDNPNVFQICTLVETKDTMTKRQKIGRGLRLCVDQSGKRCFDPEANTLTVIANESYKEFADGLQNEFEKEGFKFGVLTPESFTNLRLVVDGEQSEKLFGFDNSRTLYEVLADKRLIDEKGAIQQELKSQIESHSLALPEEFEPMRGQIEQVIAHKAEKLPVRNKAEEVEVHVRDAAEENAAFLELWRRIRPRTKFELHVDTDALIAESIAKIQQMEKIEPLQIRSYRSDLDIDDAGVSVGDEHSSLIATSEHLAYDLPDPIAELQDVVGLTRKTLKRILEGCGRLDEFAINPVTFITQVAAAIDKAKRMVIPKGITYSKLPEDKWYGINVLSPEHMKGYLGQNAFVPSHLEKWLYDHVVYDSTTIERPFAQQLDRDDDVPFCTKLPDSFIVDTPFGSYNPDWAYVRTVEGKQTVYFVEETKGGSKGQANTRPEEQSKIDCAKIHFAELSKDFPDLEYIVGTKHDKVMG